MNERPHLNGTARPPRPIRRERRPLAPRLVAMQAKPPRFQALPVNVCDARHPTPRQRIIGGVGYAAIISTLTLLVADALRWCGS